MSSIKSISLNNIILSSTNPRKAVDDESIKELANSILKHGLIQPVTVRPTEEESTFELISGERRFRAHKVAGIDEIRADVRTVDDEEAFDIQITENLHREDVHPLEEAQAFKKLREDDHSTDSIAKKVGKSSSYVLQRIQLNALIDPLKVEFTHNPEFRIGHGLLLSKHPDRIQEVIFDRYLKEGAFMSFPTVSLLKSNIESKYLMNLDEAIFDVTDEQLVPEAGPCSSCAKRSGANPGLFPEADSDDICHDKQCFEHKTDSLLKNLADQYKDDDNVFFCRTFSENQTTEELEQEGYQVLKKYDHFDTLPDEDSEDIPQGLMLSGADKGKIFPIKLYSDATGKANDSGKQKIEDLKQKKEREKELKFERRQRDFNDLLSQSESFTGNKEGTDDQYLVLLTCLYMAYDELGYGISDELREQLGMDEYCSGGDFIDILQHIREHYPRIDDLMPLLGVFVREMVVDSFQSKTYENPNKWPKQFLIKEFAKTHFEESFEDISQRHEEKSQKKLDRYDERIGNLKDAIEQFQDG